MTREATAHAPGSVTTTFAPVSSAEDAVADGDAGDGVAGTTDDGTAAAGTETPTDADATGGDTGGEPSGSRGISLATAAGVQATVRPAGTTTVTLDGERTSFTPVEGVLDRLGVTATVELDAAIPVGAGFGASGAATLATAVAAAAAFGLDRDRDALVAASHRAEVAAGTGLGDVFVQRDGGLAYDTGDGRARRFPDARVSYVSHGGIATERVLGDPAAMARVREAAADAFAAFDPDAPLAETIAVGRRFAEATGLVTDRVRETLDQVERDGGEATMAMVGESVVAVGTGRLPHTTRVADDGVRLVGSLDRE